MDDSGRWSEERAWEWYRQQPWLCGFNYVPSTAINTTEMWQGDTFDAATIDRELGWARELGLNCCRVFLQYLAREADPAGFLVRLDRFLALADSRGLSTMVCLFDDCAFSGRQPYLGPQDQPVPGIHNSGWVPSLGHERVADRRAWPQLEAFVRAVIGRFVDDRRVLLWDLYNELGNGRMGDRSLPLVEAVFRWARAAEPTQPLTVGIWRPELAALTQVSLERSDIVSFHNYFDLATVEQDVAQVAVYRRPIICTEWMRRKHGSTFESHLPYFLRARIGSFLCSLVNGRTQTHFPWGSPCGAAEPPVWYHDMLRADGTPQLPEEIEVLAAVLREERAPLHP